MKTFPGEPEFSIGKWTARVNSDPNWKEGKRNRNGTPQGPRQIVTITYGGREVYAASGVIAFLNARELISFLHRRGYVPKPDRLKCMAELGAAARVAAGLRQKDTNINPGDVGPGFIKGLPLAHGTEVAS